ncbi:threonine--tRNA ligase [Candidatus Parcubacteria bacterium]|nr:threonine--tRNA ligase [Candidatus Parcubacteria bacterium]
MADKQHMEHIRHSLAHLLAAAVLELWPETKPTIGPAIENGFYYDFEFASPISDKDFPKIEQKMRELLKTWKSFEKIDVTPEEAKEKFKNNPYKLELIDEIVGKGEKVTLYKSGEFTDLCRGGHVENPSKDISSNAFKLDRIAGAYWRGSEKNKMLTRIYGLAFESKEELEGYIKMQEEAEKRDHRKLGKDLGLFVFSDIVGKGLPLWTEKGATIRRELERFIVDEEIKRGYKHVYTPDIAKIDLYKKSGHYPYYKDSMYAPIKVDEEEFMLRPMTCPHHFELYLSQPRSYRELPMRIAELAKLYRYEQSGELTGLIRVRSFCLADAHIIAKDPEQAADEVHKALDLIEYIAQTFGLKMGEHYWYQLSLGDRTNPDKYFKNDAAWDEAENRLREVLQKRNAHFVEAPAEAAFYGPKIDIQMKNVRGKDDTAFTVQYDFVMPERFNLTYTDKDGLEKQPIVIHRSSIGAIERVIAFLIEHYAGNFPLWLAPVQVKVLSVRDTHNEFAQKVVETLRKASIRVEFDGNDEGLGKKVRAAKVEKVPYWLVIGDKEVEANKVTLESRDHGQLGQISTEELLSKLQEEIKNKK